MMVCVYSAIGRGLSKGKGGEEENTDQKGLSQCQTQNYPCVTYSFDWTFYESNIPELGFFQLQRYMLLFMCKICGVPFESLVICQDLQCCMCLCVYTAELPSHSG